MTLLIFFLRGNDSKLLYLSENEAVFCHYFKKHLLADNNVAGKDYPLLTALNNGSGEKTYRVNLLGEQLGEDQALAFRIIGEESTAVEGTHYSLPEGNIATLPANSSFAQLKINVLDFASASGTVQLVLELTGNEQVKASERYKRIGIRINLQ